MCHLAGPSARLSVRNKGSDGCVCILVIYYGIFMLLSCHKEIRMPKIIPIRDLKDTSDVLNLCEEVAEPIFVTKNGYGAMVIMSMETYERTQWINDVRAKVEVAEEAIRKGQYEKADVVIARLKEKHGL